MLKLQKDPWKFLFALGVLMFTLSRLDLFAGSTVVLWFLGIVLITIAASATGRQAHRRRPEHDR